MPNLAALRAAIFLLSAKNRWGGAHMCPPAVRGLRVLINPAGAGPPRHPPGAGGGGGGIKLPPPAISASKWARNTKFGRWVDLHKSGSWCKFSDSRSIFRGSNDVIIINFSQFSANRAELQLNASGTQTITDRNDLQKRKDAQWNYLSLTCPQIWPQVNGLASRGQNIPRSNTYIFQFSFFVQYFWLEQCFWPRCVSLSRRCEWYPFWPREVNLKIWPEVKGQVRSN